MGIASGTKGYEKLEVIRLHRLLEFDRVWQLYVEGKVTAARVKERADLMLKVGLPESLRVGIKNKGG